MISNKAVRVAVALSIVVLGTASMGGQERDPRTLAYHFAVTAGEEGYDLGSWSKVSGLDVTWDLAEYRSGGAADNSRWYFPANTKYTTVVLSRAASSEAELVIAWLQRIAETGQSPTVTIRLLDYTGDVVVSWELENVVPTKYTIGGFSADDTGVAIETLVLSHEGLRVVCERAC